LTHLHYSVIVQVHLSIQAHRLSSGAPTSTEARAADHNRPALTTKMRLACVLT
jgi:hypothetical protein